MAGRALGGWPDGLADRVDPSPMESEQKFPGADVFYENRIRGAARSRDGALATGETADSSLAAALILPKAIKAHKGP